MPRKLGSGSKDTLDYLMTALDRLLAARMYLCAGGANYTLAQVARTIKNLEKNIRQAERRSATQLRLGPASEQAQHSSKAAKAQWEKTIGNKPMTLREVRERLAAN